MHMVRSERMSDSIVVEASGAAARSTAGTLTIHCHSVRHTLIPKAPARRGPFIKPGIADRSKWINVRDIGDLRAHTALLSQYSQVF